MNDKSRELCQGLGQLAETAGRMLGLVSEMMAEPLPLVVHRSNSLEQQNARLRELLNEALADWARRDTHPASRINRDVIRRQAGML
jgi:hypothetical protein